MTEPKGTVVAGRGVIADAVVAALCRMPGGPVPVTADPADLRSGAAALILADDAWTPEARVGAARAAARRARVPFLPIRCELDRAVVGPFDAPGGTGCGRCAETRRRLSRRNPRGHGAVVEAHGSGLAERPSRWLTESAAVLIGSVVADEVTGPPSGRRCTRAVLYVALDTLSVSTHRFLPDPLCVECGQAPDDSPEAARLTLRDRLRRGPSSYRADTPVCGADELKRLYVDPELGIVRGLHRRSDAGLAVSVAPLSLRGEVEESGYGRDVSYRMSELTAMYEALERYGGMEPGGKRTVVTASFEDVRDVAVDPASLGLHSEAAYRSPGFRYAPYDPTTEYRWVWGYSFARAEPVLVPESYAYYRTQHDDRSAGPFVYETSNGCALGGCVEEAVLHGLLEVAERDAFLMTWYARLPVPRIARASAAGRRVPALAGSLEATTGYAVHLFDMTMEQGVPAVWALAVDARCRDDRPRAVSAAAAHPVAEQAAESALSELGPILRSLIRGYIDQADRALGMLRDPSLVQSMDDHATMNSRPEAFPRLSFLLDSGNRTTFAAMTERAAFGDMNLTNDLRTMIDRYWTSGLDIVVVDQTTPEHTAGRLTCVKVLVPGTLSMTFGEAFRRTDGISRLRDVPHWLGYRDRPLLEHEINRHPHPFP